MNTLNPYTGILQSTITCNNTLKISENNIITFKITIKQYNKTDFYIIYIYWGVLRKTIFCHHIGTLGGIFIQKIPYLILIFKIIIQIICIIQNFIYSIFSIDDMYSFIKFVDGVSVPSLSLPVLIGVMRTLSSGVSVNV